MKGLSIKKILLILMFILAVLGGIVVSSMVYLAQESGTLEQRWQDYQLEYSEKARLTSQLNSMLGYGGVIHAFKNMVLRRDQSRHDGISSALGAADIILVQYSTLSITERERAAIEDIRSILTKYKQALNLVSEAITRGDTPDQIDQLVRVDDTLALRGVQALRSENLMLRRGASEEVGKALNVSELRSNLGYGGMIHAFKNYVLRKEERYGQNAERSLQLALKSIENFRALGASSSEALALDDIEAAINGYANGLDKIGEMILNDASIQEIDDSVKVDDVLALRGLDILDREINRQIEHLADDMSEELSYIVNAEKVIAIVVTCLVVLTMMLCAWFVLRHIVRPVGEMTAVMTRLAQGDHSLEVPKYIGEHEVGRMAKAIAVFKENAVRREEIETELVQANEEMVDQLTELREMRITSDAQTEKALTLAESLSTARDQALDATQQAESDKERIRAIVDTVSDGIITIDTEGTIKSANIAAELTFGYQESELLNKNVRMLMPESYSGDHDGFIANYLKTGKGKIISPRGRLARRREVTGLKKDGGTFPLELSIGVSNVQGEQMFTGVVRDISKQKEVETLKAEFVSTVSHELRTPLTSIKGSLGLLSSGVTGANLDEQSADLLTLSMRNIDRLADLINDILDIEKLESGSLEFSLVATSVEAILDDALMVNQHYAVNNGVTFELDVENAKGTVNADSNRIAQVMSNLLSNAAKFSPKNGVVVMGAKHHTEGMIRFYVSDHGDGIPDEFRARIFERFTQVDSSDRRKKGGTGLGMAISKSIIDSHQGHIDFTSVVGEGTTFYFDLPVAAVSAESDIGGGEIRRPAPVAD